MASVVMTLSDNEGHFGCVKPFYLLYFGKYILCYLRYVYT